MRKRKQTVVLASLLIFMAVLVVAYFAMAKVAKNKAEDENEDDAIELYSLDTDTATKLVITNENGSISFVKKDGTWCLESDKEFPLDETNVSTMLFTLKTIKASRSVVEDAEDLSEYGLDQPKITISIELKGGISAKVELGNEVPIQGGYYGLVDGENHVYVMDESYYTDFSYKLSDLMLSQKAPSIDAEKITDLKTEDGKGTSFEATLNTDTTWSIIGPYKDIVRGDASKLQELFGNYSSLTFGDCVAYDCKDASTYGISKDSAHIDINYYEEVEVKKDDTSTSTATDASTNDTKQTTTENQPREYQLLIGTNDGNGNYYVQQKGTNYIYRMDETAVEDLLNVDAFDYVYNYMVSDTVDTIDKITIDTNNTITKLSLKETTTTDKDGKKNTEYVCKRNKKTIDYDKFSDAYSGLRAIAFKGEIDKEKIKGDDVYATLTIHGSSADKTIQFQEYDDNNYYRVSIDGEKYFLVEIKEVQSMINKFVE
ncbi:MAG: DUF4340 domain-containing protein [Velocimicrobium sp.]